MSPIGTSATLTQCGPMSGFGLLSDISASPAMSRSVLVSINIPNPRPPQMMQLDAYLPNGTFLTLSGTPASNIDASISPPILQRSSCARNCGSPFSLT